jgi:trehalose 6-phosphate synthase/phosphatase
MYRQVNERFADVVAEHVQAGDCVWIHDYHLMLVPKLLRERVPNARIGFFLHTPFPDATTFGAIPESRELLDGVLGASVIGLHTLENAQHFQHAVARTLGYQTHEGQVVLPDRRVVVCAEPMGIDVASFQRVAGDSEVIAEAARIRGESGAAVLLGVDRLDYTKGILQRLLAFEYLLEQHPELRTRVRLIQIAVPSRETVQAYRDLRGHVEDAVQRINRVFGQGGWTPIEYLYGSVDLSTLVSLYRSADVMLVTPLRDGMNLVAKEFVAARTDEDGVLVLSRQAGAAHELQAALLASPQRIDQLAETYFAALMMPRHERRVRMRRLREAITRNDVFDWASRLIDRLGGDAIGAGRSAVARIINDGEGDLPCAGLSFA